MAPQLRLFYAAGPGDIIGTYRHWKNGQDDPSQVALTYSGQFYDVCRELGAQGYVIAAHPHRELVRDGQFTLENLPRPWPQARGIFYHVMMIWYGLLIVARALRFRASAAVIAEGTTHWFVLSLLAVCGVRIIPALHCVLWPKFHPPGRAQRLLNRLNGFFFRRQAWTILSASQEINRQVEQITDGKPRPVIDFLPTYRRETFAGVRPPHHDGQSFHVLFAGRVERDKGVFDLLEIARRFVDEGHTKIEFDMCGAGSALEELRAAAQGVEHNFHIHGYCQKPQMQAMLDRAHALIVPTTTSFVEGFNQVVVEGVLAGRPVITSSVCPALEYVRNAVVEVAPGDVKGYGDAILALQTDHRLYEQKRLACSDYQEQFYAYAESWAAALQQALGTRESGLQVLKVASHQ